MFNKNLNPIIDISKINKSLLNLKDAHNFFIIDHLVHDGYKKININLKKNKQINVYLYIICNAKNKQYEITCNHKQSSQCNIFIKTLVNTKGNVKVNIKNIVDKNINNVKINQDVQGLIFDANSKINVTPSMLIDNNKIVANHSVNIGSLNPESLFYLMSKGLTKSQATIKLTEGMFKDLYIEQSMEHLKVYNNMIKQVNNLLKK